MNMRTRQVRLFLSTPQPCPYLENRSSRSLILDPDIETDTALYSLLTARGFRRSGDMVYRPHCDSCRACIPVRVPVADFRPGQQQQRTLKRGRQLTVSICPPLMNDENYALYQRYIEQRHADGSMFPPSRRQFEDFLGQPLPYACFVEFRLNQRLLAVAVCDLLDDGLSAVYSFFDPDDRYYSLGRLAVLWQISEAQRRGLPYLYLGYWIRDCQKMSYKTDYQPLQVLHQDRWLLLDSLDGDADFQFAVSGEIPL